MQNYFQRSKSFPLFPKNTQNVWWNVFDQDKREFVTFLWTPAASSNKRKAKEVSSNDCKPETQKPDVLQFEQNAHKQQSTKKEDSAWLGARTLDTRYISSLRLFKTGGAHNLCELDSHANTCVAGEVFRLLAMTGRVANVYGFQNKQDKTADVPIALAAPKWSNINLE